LEIRLRPSHAGLNLKHLALCLQDQNLKEKISSPPKEITFFFVLHGGDGKIIPLPVRAGHWQVRTCRRRISFFQIANSFGEQRNDVTKLEAPSRVTQRNEGCCASAQEVPCSLSGNYFRRWKFSQASYFPRRAWH
jgi:hypothetical protein